ncbi:S-layer homology domain-containing protein [Oscillibacter sp. CU971]|uniref:S-layer homology domain-containing protein n=1 Tax=Oscillibacter sp. CU971 TaxID=2780102 RepID=UPI0035B43064
MHYNFKNGTFNELVFTDVKKSDYFADAVLWAVENNITAGTSKTTFSPSTTCSKAQILTFLWRANGSPDPTAANPFTDIKPADYFYKSAL